MQAWRRVYRKMRHGAGVLVVLACLAASAQANPTGIQDPAFDSALTLWLGEDEAAALPAFAEMARTGNTAAQLLLALIDKTPSYQGAFIHHLDRPARIALLRQDGGVSGKSWVHEAAVSSVLAQHWRDLWHMQGGYEIAQGFFGQGESRAARYAVMTLARRQDSRLAPEIGQADFAQALRHLGGLDAQSAQTLHAGDPRRHLAGLSVSPEDLQDWLQISDLAAPLRVACATHCPETQPQCSAALFEGLGSYEALALTGAPWASLIPEDRWAHSPRGMAALARQIMLRVPTRMRERNHRQIAALDSCAAGWLAEEYSAYSFQPREFAPPEK